MVAYTGNNRAIIRLYGTYIWALGPKVNLDNTFDVAANHLIHFVSTIKK